MAYTTVDLVKTYLDISSTGDDTLIVDLIDSAQTWIETKTARTFESTGDTTRNYTVGIDTDGLTLWLDEDLAAITTVTTNADASTGTELSTGEYVTMPRNFGPYYALKIKASSDEYWTYTDDPADGVTVTGRFAYSVTAPNDIAHLCKRLTAYLYRQKDAQVFDVTAILGAGLVTVPQGFPSDAQDIIDSYHRR